MPRKLAAGNWKMNGDTAGLDMLAELNGAHADAACDIAICPPHVLLVQAALAAASGPVAIGAQDCHAHAKGAFTGDISAQMVAQTGARYAIVGHSERREAYGETDAQVSAKAQAAQGANIVPIVCLGESLEQREAGTALDVIAEQLAGSVPDGSTADTVVVAYEPIWAIGTGKIPTMEQIAEVHALMRKNLIARFGDTAVNITLLYGGSVKPGNATDIFALDNVNGALVGGASLTVADFSPIISALSDS